MSDLTSLSHGDYATALSPFRVFHVVSVTPKRVHLRAVVSQEQAQATRLTGRGYGKVKGMFRPATPEEVDAAKAELVVENARQQRLAISRKQICALYALTQEVNTRVKQLAPYHGIDRTSGFREENADELTEAYALLKRVALLLQVSA